MDTPEKESSLKVVFFDGITAAVPEDWRIRPGKDKGEWLWHSPDNELVLAIFSGVLEGNFENNLSIISEFLDELGDNLVSSSMDELDEGVLFTATVDHVEDDKPHRTFRWYLVQNLETGPIVLRFVHSVPRTIENASIVILLNKHLDDSMRKTWSEAIDPKNEVVPPDFSPPHDGRLRLERLYGIVNILIPAHWVTDISDPELAECFDEADTDENLTLSIALDYFTGPNDSDAVVDLDWLEKAATRTIAKLQNKDPKFNLIEISKNMSEASVDCWSEIENQNDNNMHSYRCSRYLLTENGFAIVHFVIVVDQKIIDHPETRELISVL